MNLIASLIICGAIVYFFLKIAKFFHLPQVAAMIFAGLFIGMGNLRASVIEPHLQFYIAAGDIALLALMFLTGLESSWKMLYKERKDEAIIAVFGAAAPFLLGYFVVQLLGYSTKVALIMGICLAVTAEATKARVLMQWGKLRTRLGSTMLGAGIIDDVSAIIMFLIINYILDTGAVQENILLSAAIIAFFIGVLSHRKIHLRSPELKKFEDLLLFGFVPFFFISMGIYFDFATVFSRMDLVVAITCTAMIGKLAGVHLARGMVPFSTPQLYLIGWAMNSRGAVEMAIALIAYRTNLIPLELFSALIVMALLTTLMFPFAMQIMIKKDPNIMD